MADFTTVPNRFQQSSTKWRETEFKDSELLPLWVADMDFKVLPELREAMAEFVKRPVFGYSYASDSLYEAIQSWEQAQHGYRFEKEAIVLIDGVVPGLSVAVQAYTEPGDAVLINTPLYPPFARTIRLNGRQIVENQLQEVAGRFEIDFERLEQQIVKEKVKLYLLCNPHNPGGRAFSRMELEQIGQVCKRHGVLLVADEIHQDLVLFGWQHHSFNTVAPDFKDFALILTAATKTFNTAGTKCAFAIIENSELREKFTKQQLRNNQHEVSTLGLFATELVYREGKAWLAELLPVLETNINYVAQELREKTQIKVMQPEATYLIWLDFSAYGLSDRTLQAKIHDEAKLILNPGESFGQAGRAHARFNAAAPFSLIKEATERLVKVFG